MPIVRFNEWAAYFEIENETPTTTEFTLAHLGALITNYLCRTKYKSGDFLPNYKPEKKSFTKDQGADFMRQLVGYLSNKEVK